jgi:AcrR family transcriptional regulator
MGRRAAPIVERREPLSRERVLRAAMDLADRNELDTLSMRNLAAVLGVEAMSIYYYFKSKDDLLSGMKDLVMMEIELPEGRPDQWRASLRTTAMSHYDALRRHKWVNGVRPSSGTIQKTATEGTSPGTIRYMESMLRRLRRAGFSPRMTHHAYHILESHVVGFSMWVAGIEAVLPKGNELAELARLVMARVPMSEYPYFHEHLEQHTGRLTKGDKSPFELGLDLILDGLDQLRDEKPKRRRSK